jgi:hypothetical protein
MGSTLDRTFVVVAGLAVAAGLSAGCGSTGSNNESGDTGMNDAASPSSGSESGSESGSALDSGSSSDQAAGDVALTDGGLACGDALCSPSQICLTPAWGCVAGPPNDAGVCPDGTEYSDASDRCLQVQPPPSCVSPAPGAGSFDCSGIGTAAGCETANAPIPSGCSRMCTGTCA